MAKRRFGLDVHVYPSPFEYETRILKVTNTLVSGAIVDRVLVVGTAQKGLPERQPIDGAREVLRVGTTLNGERLLSRTLMFLEWSARVVSRLRREPVDMVNCHSLSVLPLCALLAWRHKATLVYEPHELETETVTSKGIRRTVSKWLERSLIGRADQVIVVTDSIAVDYRRDYGLSNVGVVVNVPALEPESNAGRNRVFRDRFKIPDDHLIFMYQGVLSESRGVHLLLEAFRAASPDRHLVIMGFGPLDADARAAAATTPNIHVYPAVPPGEVMAHTRGADVGFALLSPDCLNHERTLPNKLFHYVHAGLPVIVNNVEAMSAVIDQYRCGWRVEYDSASIAALVSAIDAAAVNARSSGAARARSELHWEREADKLKSLYGHLRPRR